MTRDFIEGFQSGLAVALALVETAEHDCNGLCAELIRDLQNGRLTKGITVGECVAWGDMNQTAKRVVDAATQE